MRCLMPLLLGTLISTVAVAADAGNRPTLVLDTGGHTAKVPKVLFTPDGRELISVSLDQTIRVWDVATGEAVRVLRPPIGPGGEGMLYAAALAPDGRTLAVAGSGWLKEQRWPIYLIALDTGRIALVLKGHESAITSLAFSPDGARLASGSGDHTARVWDAATGACERVLEGHTKVVYGVAFSPDGARLATASLDTTGRVWDVATGRAEAVLRGHTKEVRCVSWRPDGQVIATGGFDRTVRLWGPDGTVFRGAEGLDNDVTSLAFSADSRALLITWGGPSGLKRGAAVLDATTMQERVRFARHTNTVLSGVLSPDGMLAATAGGNYDEIHLWKTADAAPVHRLAGRGRSSFSAAWGPDGATVAWGNTCRIVNSNDLVKWNDLGPLERSFHLATLEFAPPPDASFRRAQPTRGTLALVSTGETTVAVRQDDRTLATLAMSNPYERVICFSLLPGDRAAVGTEFDLYLYDARTGNRLRTFIGHTGGVLAVAPSPDGRLLLSASNDLTLRVWDPDRDWPLVSLFVAGDEWVAWTPEGYYAASPGGETLIGWHVNNGLKAMASYYPASQFRKTLYRPDVIERLLEAGSLDKALADADHILKQVRQKLEVDHLLRVYAEANAKAVADLRGRRTEEANAKAVADLRGRRTEVAQILPPKVTITSPVSAKTRIDGPMIDVATVAHSVGNNPIISLRLLLDGRPVPDALKTFPSPVEGEGRARWTVAVPPGTHQLIVQADSGVSKGLSDPIEVVRETAAASATAQVAGTLYVLAIGINDYPDNRLKLDCASPDARALRQAFLTHSRRLFRDVEARLLLDRQATRAEILGGLQWLGGTVKAGDVAVVFYAGHGYCSKEGVFYLVPVDADLRDLSAAGISGEALEKSIGELPCTTVLILDACYAASIGAKKRKTRALPVESDTVLRHLIYDSGLVVMCAAYKDQEAAEENGHGFFTRAIVEGLEGKADKYKTGRVEVDDLQTYVKHRVRELSDNEQEPTIGIPPTVRSFALSQP